MEFLKNFQEIFEKFKENFLIKFEFFLISKNWKI